MALIRYPNPFRELEELFEETLSTPIRGGVTTPVADVYLDDKEDNIIVEAQLPGYNEDDIQVELENGALMIRAEAHEQSTDKAKGRKYVVRESASSFYRRIGLPKNVEADKIEADFDDGVLKVTVPMKDLPKPKRIAISKTKKK